MGCLVNLVTMIISIDINVTYYYNNSVTIFIDVNGIMSVNLLGRGCCGNNCMSKLQ
jgi:hypothetical protein